MAKWKLFGKSEKDKKTEIEKTPEEKTEEVTTEEEIIEESKDEPLAEYSETLESTSTSKKKSEKKSSPPTDQRVWRDVDLIEEKVDKLHITKAQKPVTELDKKVDGIIEKRKKK